MNFESLTPIDIKNLFLTALMVSAGFSFFITLIFYFLLSRKKKEFENQKSIMLLYAESFFTTKIKEAMNMLLKALKTNNPNLEYIRGEYAVKFKIDADNIFKFGKTFLLDKHLEEIEEKLLFKNQEKLIVESNAEIINIINKMIILTRKKKIKKINDLFNYEAEKSELIFQLNRAVGSLEEEILEIKKEFEKS